MAGDFMKKFNEALDKAMDAVEKGIQNLGEMDGYAYDTPQQQSAKGQPVNKSVDKPRPKYKKKQFRI